MRKTILIIAVIATGLIVTISACNNSDAKSEPAPTKISKEELVKRGNYLVTIAGCDDCHSPKKMGPMGPEIDMEHRLSGYPADRPFPKFDSNVVKKGIAMFNEDLTAAAGPWGVSFTANITSDATGIGNWTEGNFMTALRKGKFKGLEASRSLLPPMPWQNYAQMTDNDLKAIFAFLQSTKPVKNVAPAPRQFADLR
ncbi:c-type cytochrome [soil metagenome]